MLYQHIFRLVKRRYKLGRYELSKLSLRSTTKTELPFDIKIFVDLLTCRRINIKNCLIEGVHIKIPRPLPK